MKPTNTPATMNTNNVTITIRKGECNLYTAKANGVPVGSVNTWLNNTFAACYAVGIKQRKALTMPAIIHEDNAAHGFTSEHNAVLWLGDMLVRYFAKNGVTANIVNPQQVVTRAKLQAMADNAREWDIKMRGKAATTDCAYMVLELMETEEHANNYCSALREVLAAFPEVDRDELETELNRFI